MILGIPAGHKRGRRVGPAQMMVRGPLVTPYTGTVSSIAVQFGAFSAGDLLVVMGDNGSEGNGNPSFSAGWTLSQNVAWGTRDKTWLLWKIATGGDTLTISYNAPQYSSPVSFVIRHFNPTNPIATSAASSGNPPNINMPGGGTAHGLAIVAASVHPSAPTAVPAGYLDLGVNSLSRTRYGARYVTAATGEDAGAFSGGSACVAALIRRK